jgi:hypothetical protein
MKIGITEECRIAKNAFGKCVIQAAIFLGFYNNI